MTGDIEGDIFVFPVFHFGALIYPRLKMLLPRAEGLSEKNYHFLLPSSMFHGLIYTFDTKNGYVRFEIPEGEQMVRNMVIISEGEKTILGNETLGEK